MVSPVDFWTGKKEYHSRGSGKSIADAQVFVSCNRPSLLALTEAWKIPLQSTLKEKCLCVSGIRSPHRGAVPRGCLLPPRGGGLLLRVRGLRLRGKPLSFCPSLGRDIPHGGRSRPRKHPVRAIRGYSRSTAPHTLLARLHQG